MAAGCPLVLMGAAERAESALPDNAASVPAPTLVDTSGTRGQEGTLLPEPLHSAIEEALAAGKRAAAIHNRRGSFQVSVCTACGQPTSCGQCGSLAAVHGGVLRCHRCGWEARAPGACASCNNLTFAPRGWGVGELAAEIGRAFPSAKVVTADTETDALPDGWQVAVGTTALLHALQEIPPADGSPALGVLALNADSLLGSPDFRATERAWQTTMALRRLATAHDAELLLLTRRPDAPATRRLLENAGTFFATELADRAATGYPPTGRLITVTATGATQQAAMVAASAAKAAFLEHCPHDLKNSRATFGPYPAGSPFRHGKWRAAFAIKAPSLTPELVAALSKCPETCSIDTNPESPE
jgi:primosomal protein N' (replication factor Y)